MYSSQTKGQNYAISSHFQDHDYNYIQAAHINNAHAIKHPV